MAITAVGFDLDDTLVVVAKDRESLLTDAANDVGAPPIDRGDYLDAHRRNLTGNSRTAIFSELLDETNGAPAPRRLAAAYRQRVNNAITPVEGAEALVENLKNQYTVGLLTNGPSRAQRAKLAELGWQNLFDAVVISGDLEAGKPNQLAFDALCQALGRPPTETVYVGDNPRTDIAGAAAANLRPIQAIYPDGPAPDSRAAAHIDRAALATRLRQTIDSL